ncbi:unnamed protein product [Trifolium pratense]|uniref:Uncharacterized protein n=1 Tax=Trifolium pratense TaxID=57577 RepID=A0ACB0L359_TRIPR|nr:unnamed protein product [Trifolium pratense]
MRQPIKGVDFKIKTLTVGGKRSKRSTKYINEHPTTSSKMLNFSPTVGSIPKCLEFLPRSSFQGNCLQSNDLNQRPSIKCGSASPAKSQPLDDVIDPVIPRGSLRDSLEIEASFLQREEELLSSWWREYAECSDKLLYKIQRWCTIWTRRGGWNKYKQDSCSGVQ